MLKEYVWLGLVSSGWALDNGLALTPPMGWLSWLGFGCNTDCVTYPTKCLSEQLVKRTADRMISDGYRDVGYEYVIIDDCWLHKERDDDGRLMADKTRFPSGIKALADYVHSKGLKFGIYQDIGKTTCAGYPGLEGNVERDVDTLVGWGIDYLKVDGCDAHEDFHISYPRLGSLLNASGRPILYSCSWPAYSRPQTDYEKLLEVCNIWRNCVDIEKSWTSLSIILDWLGRHALMLSCYAGPGHFNDPDMLIIGNSGLTVDQARVQMAVWAIVAAPLMISADLDEMLPEFRDILLNKDVVDISQCELARQGSRHFKRDGLEIWSRETMNGQALAFVNRNAEIRTATFTFFEMDLPRLTHVAVELFDQEPPRILDPNKTFEVTINPTGVKFYRMSSKIDDWNEIDNADPLFSNEDNGLEIQL